MAKQNEAKDYFKQSIKINPKFSRAYWNFTGLSKNIKEAETYLNKGISKQNLNDYQGAIVEYTKAIKLNANYAKAYNNRGVLKFYFLKDKLGACEDARKAEILGFDASNLIKVSCD